VRVLEIIRQHFAVILSEKEYGAKEYTFPPGHPKAKPYPFESLLKAERERKEEIWLDDAGDVNVRGWLDGVTDPTTRRRQQQAIVELDQSGEGRPIYTEKIVFGVDMSKTQKTQVTTGAVTGNVGAVSGENVAQTQIANIDQRVQHLVAHPQELLGEIAKLRSLIADARKHGADADDCENAEGAVTQLEDAIKKPAKPEAKKAKGALAMLKGISAGFKAYADIGENFEKVLKYVGPAIGIIAGKLLSGG
jgi:hypothetical protein